MSVRITEGPDAGAIWHYGDPLREQRALTQGEAGVDLGHREAFTITGADRHKWLNDITSQEFVTLASDTPVSAYILNAQGHLVHAFEAVDDGNTLWGHTEPGRRQPLLAWLRRMVFTARVELAELDADHAVILPPAPGVAFTARHPRVVPTPQAEEELGSVRAGLWAYDALRIAAGVPRPFVDTDERTIPNELANPEADQLGAAVHLKKGCYPGQETVARVYNLGRPPRRLTWLHLDGSVDRLPEVGAEILADGRVVGRMGSSQRHYELGPIGLALLKRNLAVDAPLSVAGIAASQELLVDPDAGLHWRPTPGLGRTTRLS